MKATRATDSRTAHQGHVPPIGRDTRRRPNSSNCSEGLILPTKYRRQVVSEFNFEGVQVIFRAGAYFLSVKSSIGGRLELKSLLVFFNGYPPTSFPHTQLLNLIMWLDVIRHRLYLSFHVKYNRWYLSPEQLYIEGTTEIIMNWLFFS